MTPSIIFIQKLAEKGFSLYDCPYSPIRPEWECFPIVKAIRQIEKETGERYQLYKSTAF